MKVYGGGKKRKNIRKCRSPQPSVDDKMIPQCHKVWAATFDSRDEQPFLSHQPLKYQATPDGAGESTGTNTQYSDFCNWFELEIEEERISHGLDVRALLKLGVED